jgi:hypothetical protein
MNNNNAESNRSNRSNIIPHDSSLRGYSVQNSFYDSPYNMDFEYGYLNLMFNITAFTARTQDMFQNIESNLYSIIELQNERRRLEIESQQAREARETREAREAREARETSENNQNINTPQPATLSSTSQESRQNIFNSSRSTSSTTNPTSPNDNLNSLFGTRNVFLGLNPMTLYNTTTTGSNASRFFRRNRSGLTIEEIEENTEIINYSSIDAEQILNTECPISRDVFTSTSVVLRLKECRHCFVPFRMMTWLESHSTCPLCRCNVIPVAAAAPAAAAETPAPAPAPAPAPDPAPATRPATTFSNIINNIRNNTNLDNLSIDNMNDDSLVFSFDLPRPLNGDMEGRELTNTYLSSLSQIFSNLNRNTTNTTNQTTEPNNSTENTNTLSEHEYDEVD